MEKANCSLKELDKCLDGCCLLSKIESKTGVKKTYVAIGGAVVVFMLIALNVWANLITNLIGFLYPAYASFKAIETKEKNDDTQWLTYWTVFGFFNVVEFFSDALLYWFPLYFLFKVAFLMYLLCPQTRGAEVMYHKFLRPFLLENGCIVDCAMDKVKAAVKEATSEKTD